MHPEPSSSVSCSIHIKVDQARSEEQGDFVDRRVEGEGNLDGTRDRSVRPIEDPHEWELLTSLIKPKEGLGHLNYISGKKIARSVGSVVKSHGNEAGHII